MKEKIIFKDLSTELKVLVIFGYVALVYAVASFVAGFVSVIVG